MFWCMRVLFDHYFTTLTQSGPPTPIDSSLLTKPGTLANKDEAPNIRSAPRQPSYESRRVMRDFVNCSSQPAYRGAS